MKGNTSPQITKIPNVANFIHRVQEQVVGLRGELASLKSKCSAAKVHKIRILSRRSRASFALLKQLNHDPRLSAQAKSLRRLTRILGPVRSLDVGVGDLNKRLSKWGGKSGSSLKFLTKALKKRGRRLRKKLPQRIQEERIASHLENESIQSILSNINHVDFYHSLREWERTARRRVQEAWPQFEKSKKIKDMHQVRIALKKWRYLMEVHSECLRTPGSDFLKDLKSLQDRLGAIHDREVLRDFLRVKKVKKRVRAKRARKPYRSLLKELKSEIRSEIDSFHREGGSFLLPLLEEELG